MKLTSLTVENFLTIREPVTIPLADQGLVLVRGDNRISASANDNGACKTGLIVDAPSVAMFGKTLRGPDVIKGQDLACRFTKEPCVLRLDFDGGNLLRKFRPYYCELALDGKAPVYGDEADATFLDMLGYGFRTYHYAQVFSGGALSKFARAEQSEQMLMVDEIQGLNFRAALDRAKAWRDEWRKKLFALETEGNALLASHTATNEALGGLIESRKGFEQTKRDRVLAASERFQQARERLEQVRKELESLRVSAGELQALQDADDAERNARAMLVTAERMVAAEEAKLPGEQRMLGSAQGHRDRARNDVAGLLHAKVCPTCRGKIVGSRVKEVQVAFQPDIDEAEKAVAEQERKVAVQEKNIKAARVVRDKAKAACAAAAMGQDALDRFLAAQGAAERVPQAEREKAQAEADVLQAGKNSVAERDATWDGEAALKETQEAAERYASEHEKNKQTRKKAEATVAAAEYWVEAFGDRGIRSLLFEGVSPFLNERLAEHLAALTSGEATVEVSALKALKSGKSREQLTVTAAWAWGAGQYAVGSGGQGGRVDLALFAALQDLGEFRSARPFLWKTWDEPGDALDARGKEVFCRWVEDETRKRGTGFLVTHQDDISNLVNADQTWTIVLDERGSRLEVA